MLLAGLEGAWRKKRGRRARPIGLERGKIAQNLGSAVAVPELGWRKESPAAGRGMEEHAILPGGLARGHPGVLKPQKPQPCASRTPSPIRNPSHLPPAAPSNFGDLPVHYSSPRGNQPVHFASPAARAGSAGDHRVDLPVPEALPRLDDDGTIIDPRPAFEAFEALDAPVALPPAALVPALQ